MNPVYHSTGLAKSLSSGPITVREGPCHDSLILRRLFPLVFLAQRVAGEPVQLQVDFEEPVSQFPPAMGLPGGDVEAGGDTVSRLHNRTARRKPAVSPAVRLGHTVLSAQWKLDSGPTEKLDPEIQKRFILSLIWCKRRGEKELSDKLAQIVFLEEGS